MVKISIWVKDVDGALKGYLKHLVKQNIMNNTVPVKFVNPDIETNEECYPCITINSGLDQDYNLAMTDNNSFDVVSKDGISTITDKPTKYDLFYQIDFWTKSLTVINELSFMWISNIPKHSILEVSKNENVYVCPLTQVGYRKLDSVVKGEAIYRRSYEIKVTIELPRSSVNDKVVGTLGDINTNITKK